jgi:GntR family transcriptional regulator
MPGSVGPSLPTIDRRPLPARVAEAIEEMIATGSLGPGDRLPGETELAEQIGVGRSTIRDALADLERAGVVERRGGVGTLVAALAPASMGLEVLESFEALAARQGWTCGTTDLRIRRARATERQATRLGVDPGTRLSVITRIKTRDGKPVAKMTSAVPEAVVAHDVLIERFDGSITDLLRGLPRSPLRHARVEVSAASANRILAEQLRVRVGSPLLVLEEEFVGIDSAVVAWNLLELAPGGVRVHVVRRT